MTDAQIDQIYALAREAFDGGQPKIQLLSFPFRMTAENLAKYRDDPNIGFWQQLKEGADSFEVTRRDVVVGVCARRYVFNALLPPDMDPAAACPELRFDAAHSEVVARGAADEAQIRKLVASGTPSIRTTYVDGGQNPAFMQTGIEVSRPEALDAGQTDRVITPSFSRGASSPPVLPR